MAILIINNYNKTKNLNKAAQIADALKKLGKSNHITISFSEISKKKIPGKVGAVVLSGSSASLKNEKSESDYSAEIEYVKQVKIPVLGICFGLQLIGKAFGSQIHTLPGRMRGFEKVKIVEPNEILSSWEKGKDITLDHNNIDCLNNLPEGFILLARSETCKIEAMKHESKPIYGVQAHIERATNEKPDGLQVLRNFVSNVVEKKTNTTALKPTNPEVFRKKVEENEEKYGLSDCIYNQCIEEFSRIKLSQLNDRHEIRVIRPFLLTWGVMGRVLGHAGVEAIRKKLKDVSKKIEPFRPKDISTANLDEIKDSIIELFDEIRETEFKSKKGKQKEVGSTAASKVLHLTCPNLFVMWDSAIRAGYKKYNGDGKDYFDFLNEMKGTAKELDTTIKDLQRKYEKSVTRILDQYNWIIFKKDPKKLVLSRV